MSSAASDFATVARVLRHPRCLNCHTVTSFPRVGDDRRRHPQNVQRGPDGHGVPGMRCSTCHQDSNQELVGVPGAPHWHLAPLSMGWEGLDDHDLAEAIKDRTRNGDRSLDDLREHLAADPLVAWAWNPGPGRSTLPISREALLQAFDAWVAAGAKSPPEGVTTF